jgi:hypothetical protein
VSRPSLRRSASTPSSAVESAPPERATSTLSLAPKRALLRQVSRTSDENRVKFASPDRGTIQYELTNPLDEVMVSLSHVDLTLGRGTPPPFLGPRGAGRNAGSFFLFRQGVAVPPVFLTLRGSATYERKNTPNPTSGVNRWPAPTSASSHFTSPRTC